MSLLKMAPNEFERLAYLKLYQLDLGLEPDPPDRQH